VDGIYNESEVSATFDEDTPYTIGALAKCYIIAYALLV
jgi:hypothetical protein